MDGKEKVGDHMTSAAAFVEGGIQDACDDSCSICLEAFCDSDPSTVTSCKHEFHLQCILEWCQRSSQCPMCWQPLSLKDPTSQELFEGVERERNIRLTPARNATIFHHPTLGDFELQHLPVGADDAELEESIIHHLAAAAAMGRAHHLARREDHRVRISGRGRPQFLLFSSSPNGQSAFPVSSPPSQREGTSEQTPEISAATPLPPLSTVGEESAQPVPQAPTHASLALSQGPGPSIVVASRPLPNRGSAAPSSPVGQDRPGPSEFQSFSESLKSRLNAVSTRYKESISKSTRGWKEKFFSRNTSVSDIGSEVRREVNAGIATVSRMMERLDTRDTNNRESASSVPQHVDDASSPTGHYNTNNGENNGGNVLSSESSTSASCTASAGPN